MQLSKYCITIFNINFITIIFFVVLTNPIVPSLINLFTYVSTVDLIYMTFKSSLIYYSIVIASDIIINSSSETTAIAKIR